MTTRRRFGRRAALVAVGVLALGVLALAAMEAARWPGIGRVLAWSVERQTGWPVAQQGCRARLVLGPWLACERFALGAEPWFDATQVRAEGTWAAFWAAQRGERLHLKALSADALQVRLVRDAGGRATWQSPRRRSEAARGARPGPEWPQVDALAFKRGDIVWDDVPGDTRLAVALRSEGAGYRAAIEGRWRRLPLALQVRTRDPVPLLQPGSGSALHPLWLEGTVGEAKVAFDGRAAALFGARPLDGAIVVSGASLARVGRPLGLTLPQTPPFELRAQLAHDGQQRWRMTRTAASIGESRLGGDFTYDTRAQPPLLSGLLVGPRLVLDDLAPSIGASASAPARTARAARGRVLPDRAFDLPSLRAMQASLHLDIDELDLGTRKVGSLRKLRAQLTLSEGSLALDGLSAAVAGGRLTGSTRLTERDDIARWTAKLKLDGIDIERWLPVVRARPGSPGRDAGAYVTGKLAADLDVSGAGRSTAQILGSLDGQADLALRNATLSHLVTEAIGIDIAQAVGVMVRGDRALPLRCALVHLTFKDGVAEVGPAVADNRDSTLRMAGRISLADETLSLALRARPKDISPLSLRAPITVTGRLADPDVGIEGNKVAGRVLGAAVLGAAVGPLAALLPLFEVGKKPEVDPCEAPAAPPR